MLCYAATLPNLGACTTALPLFRIAFYSAISGNAGPAELRGSEQQFLSIAWFTLQGTIQSSIDELLSKEKQYRPTR